MRFDLCDDHICVTAENIQDIYYLERVFGMPTQTRHEKPEYHPVLLDSDGVLVPVGASGAPFGRIRFRKNKPVDTIPDRE